MAIITMTISHHAYHPKDFQDFKTSLKDPVFFAIFKLVWSENVCLQNFTVKLLLELHTTFVRFKSIF